MRNGVWLYNRICPVKLGNESEKGVCVYDRSRENRKCKPATEGRNDNKVDEKNV